MRIKITVVDQIGPHPCHRGHRVGDEFDFDKDRGKLCPLAAHVLFPMVNILRYDGKLKSDRFCCPDVGTINVFQIERIDD